MSALVVIPSIFQPYTNACLLSMRIPAEQVMIVDNTLHNRGVPVSWNAGRKRVLDEGTDWLVICSAAVRFGPSGGRDFLDALSQSDDRLFRAAFMNGIPVVEAGNGLGWHLIAFQRSVLERVGPFDENFSPAYHEDNDYSYRIQLSYGVDSRAPGFVGPLWPKVDIDARLVEVAHGIKQANIAVDFVALSSYYQRKWGGESGKESYKTPFCEPDRSLDWFPERLSYGI